VSLLIDQEMKLEEDIVISLVLIMPTFTGMVLVLLCAILLLIELPFQMSVLVTINAQKEQSSFIGMVLV
jgi:hypothetical protein